MGDKAGMGAEDCFVADMGPGSRPRALAASAGMMACVDDLGEELSSMDMYLFLGRMYVAPTIGEPLMFLPICAVGVTFDELSNKVLSDISLSVHSTGYAFAYIGTSCTEAGWPGWGIAWHSVGWGSGWHSVGEGLAQTSTHDCMGYNSVGNVIGFSSVDESIA